MNISFSLDSFSITETRAVHNDTDFAPFSVTGNALSIDMSALKRPTATGTITDSSHISVNFPEDKSYTGPLEQPGTILWSNNST
jgi:hypothetical protein